MRSVSGTCQYDPLGPDRHETLPSAAMRPQTYALVLHAAGADRTVSFCALRGVLAERPSVAYTCIAHIRT